MMTLPKEAINMMHKIAVLNKQLIDTEKALSALVEEASDGNLSVCTSTRTSTVQFYNASQSSEYAYEAIHSIADRRTISKEALRDELTRYERVSFTIDGEPCIILVRVPNKVDNT